MTAYRTILVGTDGSATSLCAVDRAAALATDAGAALLIAYPPTPEQDLAPDRDVLGPDAGYQVVGSAPAEDTLRTARDRALGVARYSGRDELIVRTT